MLIQLLIISVLLIGNCSSLFVPDQLPSILSFLYANVPPIRKGTDSRVGVGFRLGPNADFQMLFEIGPQEATQSVDPQSNAKREINDRYYVNTKNYSKKFSKKKPSKKKLPWIHMWQDNLAEEQQEKNVNYFQKPQIDPDVVRHLSQLYEKSKTITNFKRE